MPRAHRFDYKTLAEFRYQIRRFLHFSEHATRAQGVNTQQHQLLLALKGLLFSVEVGILGSLLPAMRASRLPVIAALKAV